MLYCFRLSPWRGKERLPLSVTSPSSRPSTHQRSSCPFLCFHAVTNCKFRNSFALIFMQIGGGCRGHYRFATFGRSDLRRFQRVFELSPVFSNSCALFCTHQNHNSFIFMRFRTLCTKQPGWGEGVGQPKEQDRSLGFAQGRRDGRRGKDAPTRSGRYFISAKRLETGE